MDEKMKKKLDPIVSISLMKMKKDEKELPKEESFEKEAELVAAEDVMSAMESKDAAKFVDALCYLLELKGIYKEEMPEESEDMADEVEDMNKEEKPV